jgi:peroxiredoxin
MADPMKARGRAALLSSVVAALAFSYACLQENQGPGLRPGSPAPPFSLPVRGGGSVSLAALAGKVVVVNFWATWCPPCVAEMPSLDRLHRGLSHEGLVVLAVAVDEDESALAAFALKAGLTLTVLRDPGGTVSNGAFRVRGYPETLVIGRDGVVVEAYRGPADWATPEAIEHFRRLLKASAR